MFFLSDYSLSTFGRPLGRKDKKPRSRIKRLISSTWNPDTANAAAVGSQLGAVGGLLSSGLHGTKKLARNTFIGTAAGLGVGTGMGIISKYRKQNKNNINYDS